MKRAICVRKQTVFILYLLTLVTTSTSWTFYILKKNKMST